MNNILAHFVRALNSAVFPAKCLSCGDLFYKQNIPSHRSIANNILSSVNHIDSKDAFKLSMESYFCDTCISHFSPVSSPLCPKCGTIFKSRAGEDHICEACMRDPNIFHSASAAGIYEGSLMVAIHHMKYKGKIWLADQLNLLLYSVFVQQFDISQIDCIVPVPLHKERFKQRGFNQAFLLIKKWDKISGDLFPEIRPLRIKEHILRRKRKTQSQTSLSKKSRIINIKNAFELIDPDYIKEKTILIVDDVYTTGATVNECAKVLIAGGAEGVHILTLARALI